MDALLLLAPTTGSDRLCRPRRFHHGAGRPVARARRARGGAVRLCRRGDPRARFVCRRAQGEFSLTDLFDRAAEAGRLYGLRLEGVWMHVGTPDAIAGAEAAIRASAG